MDFVDIGFILKKLIGMFLMPIPISLLCIILGLWWFRKAPIKARLSLISAFFILGLSSWHPVADELIRPHESYFPIFDVSQPVQAVVVLGSASHSAPPGSPAVMNLGSSALFRLEEGLRILRANPNAILIVTGYAGFGSATPHAKLLQQSAIDLGVDPLRIFDFPTARDTEQEAHLTSSLLKNKKFALVTEASHLKRSMIFFEQEGLHPIAAPATHTGSHYTDWRIDSRAIYKTERAIYEYLGRSWQWLKGLL